MTVRGRATKSNTMYDDLVKKRILVSVEIEKRYTYCNWVHGNIRGRPESQPQAPLAPRCRAAGRLARSKRRSGRHGAGPVEAENDPAEQGVQVEAPAGDRSTHTACNNMHHDFQLSLTLCPSSHFILFYG